MADYVGNNGAINVGSAVGNIKSWSIDENMDPLDNSVMGQGAATNRSSERLKWSGSLEVLFDPADAGQQALSVGAEISGVTFDAQGPGSGNERKTGDIVVTGVSSTVNIGELLVQSISFVGSGDLVKSTIA